MSDISDVNAGLDIFQKVTGLFKHHPAEPAENSASVTIVNLTSFTLQLDSVYYNNDSSFGYTVPFPQEIGSPALALYQMSNADNTENLSTSQMLSHINSGIYTGRTTASFDKNFMIYAIYKFSKDGENNLIFKEGLSLNISGKDKVGVQDFILFDEDNSNQLASIPSNDYGEVKNLATYTHENDTYQICAKISTGLGSVVTFYEEKVS